MASLIGARDLSTTWVYMAKQAKPAYSTKIYM